MKAINVVAGVLLREGKVLIARRKPDKSLGGKWEFAGGKVDSGEGLEVALKRELFEELNILFEIGSYVGSNSHRYGDLIVTLHAFLVHCPRDVASSTDHDEFAWTDLHEILEYDLAPADIPLVDMISRHLKN